MYADDTQFWVSFCDDAGSIENEAAARGLIAKAFSVIESFMYDNHLKLNPGKTQFIPFSRKKDTSSYAPLVLNDQVTIFPSCEVRNLGVIMDSNLSFVSHVNQLRRSCFYQLRRLRSIGLFVPSSQLETLIHAFITSRLDFCCSIYHPLPKNLVSRVQTIQNACAKFVTGAKKFDSATAARFKLHWLPVAARSKFRILTYAYRIVHAKESIPKYLSEPYTTQKHERVTRNNLSNTLHCLYKFRLVTVGCRSVYCTILDLWNSLPGDLRYIPTYSAFKRSLKTYLFREAYELF